MIAMGPSTMEKVDVVVPVALVVFAGIVIVPVPISGWVALLVIPVAVSRTVVPLAVPVINAVPDPVLSPETQSELVTVYVLGWAAL